MLFDAHTRSFAALGGVARRGIYDNMKTAADRVKKGRGRVVQRALCGDVRALPVRCRLLQRRLRLGGRHRGEESAGQPPARVDRACGAGRAWMNSTPGWRQRCKALWEKVRHPEHEAFSIAEMLEHERGN